MSRIVLLWCAVPDSGLSVREETQRLDALWRIANRPDLRGDQLIDAMLSEAAASMRPGLAFAGTLGHIEGPDFILDAVAGRFGVNHETAQQLWPIGKRVACIDTLDACLSDGARTQSWHDVQMLDDVPARARAAGVRSQITTRFQAGGAMRVLTFGSSDAPPQNPFGPEDSAYVELLGSFFARHIELEHMQHSLVAAELVTRHHADRLAALWQIAGNTSLDSDELLFAMLRQASGTIRPTQHFGGFLGRIEGDEIVVAALSVAASEPTVNATRMQIGDRKRLSETVIPRERRTQAWDDLLDLAERPPAATLLGWRAVISTIFDAAGATFVLTFASPEPSTLPFSDDDLAYVDVLAASIAKQLDVTQLNDSLRGEQELSHQQAERLEALLSIASIPTIRGDMLTRAMMGQAASGLRPGQNFRGILCSIEGDDVTIVCVSFDVRADDPQTEFISPGKTTSLALTIIPAANHTRAWNDLTLAGPHSMGGRDLHWASAISRRFQSGERDYALTLYSHEPVLPPFNADDTAYLEVLCASFAKQLEVNRLEDSLREAEEQSRRHAERLEALWKIVNDTALRDNELLLAMLHEAAGGIQIDREFSAMLWRVDGDNMVVEAVAEGSPGVEASQLKLGEVMPLAGSIVGSVIAEGVRTRSWADLRESGRSSAASVAHGTRSLIVTTFAGGGSTWGLLFGSNQPSKPLTRQDHAYVETLASFFANHVQQRWQFERIQYQQSHDVLTGLLNRSQFRSQARAAARTSARYGVILVGIDAFREINESYGHMIGDALLVEVANALKQRAEPNEIVGRISGDIFGIYVGDPSGADAVRQRAVVFSKAFLRPFSTGDRDGKEFVSRTASFGVAVAPDDGTLIDGILSRADAALVNAKRRGHGTIRTYETGMEGEALRRTSLRNELTEAVASDQFELYFQPHIELQTGDVSGCEALIRWNHPTRGLLSPLHFIPFAEQNGMIGTIDDWVMKNAFQAAKELSDVSRDFRLYFNLSGRQAGDPKLIRAFVDAARDGVQLEHIGVEITETDAMRDVAATRHVCRALRRLNVRIAIDDFGTGYSSLTSLKQLPVDIVKIDRSFIAGLLTDPHDATIADMIITIAARFGFESLAEGVEQLGEIGWLRQRSCRYMQGFAICHPLPMVDFKAWLAGHGE